MSAGHRTGEPGPRKVRLWLPGEEEGPKEWGWNVDLLEVGPPGRAAGICWDLP